MEVATRDSVKLSESEKSRETFDFFFIHSSSELDLSYAFQSFCTSTRKEVLMPDTSFTYEAQVLLLLAISYHSNVPVVLLEIRRYCFILCALPPFIADNSIVAKTSTWLSSIAVCKVAILASA